MKRRQTWVLRREVRRQRRSRLTLRKGGNDERRREWRQGEPHRPPRGVEFVAHNFAAHTTSAAETVWVALTDPAKTTEYFYGMAAHSTWIPDAPVDLRRDDCAVLTGRVLCWRPHERLSCVVQSGETGPPVYLTWSIRPAPSGSTIRLEVDEVNGVDSREDAEDIWLPVLAALPRLLETPDSGMTLP